MKYYQRVILKMFVNFVSGTIGVKCIVKIDSNTKRYKTKKKAEKSKEKQNWKVFESVQILQYDWKCSHLREQKNQMDKYNVEALG